MSCLAVVKLSLLHRVSPYNLTTLFNNFGTFIPASLCAGTLQFPNQHCGCKRGHGWMHCTSCPNPIYESILSKF